MNINNKYNNNNVFFLRLYKLYYIVKGHRLTVSYVLNNILIGPSKCFITLGKVYKLLSCNNQRY